MSREKQIEELTNELIRTNSYGTLNAVAEHLYNAGYRKQSEEIEKYRERIYNQREELHRLNKRINNLIQSREAWKKQAERVGKQLHDVLNKQSEDTVKHGTWYHGVENGAVYAKCSACGRKMNYSCYGYAYCALCGARMDGAKMKGEI